MCLEIKNNTKKIPKIPKHQKKRTMTSIKESMRGMCGDGFTTFTNREMEAHKQYIRGQFGQTGISDPELTRFSGPTSSGENDLLSSENKIMDRVIIDISAKLNSINERIDSIEEKLNTPWYIKLYKLCCCCSSCN